MLGGGTYLIGSITVGQWKNTNKINNIGEELKFQCAVE